MLPDLSKFFAIYPYGIYGSFAYAYGDDYGNREWNINTGVTTTAGRTYYIKVLKCGYTCIQVYINNTLIITLNKKITGLSSLRIGGYNNRASYDKSRMYWIRVRKYADQDPIVRSTYIGSSQSQPYSTNPYRYQFTYLYVIPIRVTSNNPIGITNLVIPISIDTKSLISQGILKSDCSDISITIYDPNTDTEVNAKQYIDPATCNTENTIIYVNIPEYFVGRDIFINVYLGSPGALPIQDPETFYWFVDLSNPSDYTKIGIFVNGTVSYNVTTNGMLINIGTDGKLVIYNK